MSTSKSVKEYESACQKVLEEFGKKYYEYETIDLCDCWVGNEVGGIALINDEFYHIDFMIKALRLNVDSESMFNYYYYSMDMHHTNTSPLKLEAWLQLGEHV